ncbi:hypothetical protein [Acuticoccus sp.]|uniref:hypothetical protein n=1 Tax=Acuticoccus sp. TaxID=1904378 RepID=UPI003B51AFB7
MDHALTQAAVLAVTLAGAAALADEPVIEGVRMTVAADGSATVAVTARHAVDRQHGAGPPVEAVLPR